MKQVTRPKYNLLKEQIFLNYGKYYANYPEAINLDTKLYKKLCKELKHKVKTVLGVSIVNYYH